MPDAAPGALVGGLRLAATTFTVLPVRSGPVTRATAAVAMRTAAVFGLGLGLAVGGVAAGLRALHSPGLLIAVIVVALTALLTRGLHLDGLADTVDALGSYRGAPRALAIMKSPEVGPFGVAAIGLALLIPVAAIAGVLGRPWWALLATLGTGYASGRLAVTWACRRGVPAARPDGLGALVAGSVGVPTLALATLLTAALGGLAVPHRPWQGPVAVLAAVAGTVALTTHVQRRIGGITGDVLGACVEIGTAISLIGLGL
jgi:adenosylcobinamide-GDP ribazoletransferase